MRLKLIFHEDKEMEFVKDAYYEAYKKSDIALKENNYDLALEILEEAIKNEQKDIKPFEKADFYAKCARIYRLKKDYDSAFAAITKAIELRGFDWDYEKRARLYEEKGDYNNAIADYTKALEREGWPAYYHLRGEIFFKKNDYDSAIADFLNTVKNCPKGKTICKGCLEAYYMCSQAYLKKGNAESAIKCLNKALKLKPDFEKAKELKEKILSKKEL